jgi:hypothetical protein
LLSCLTLLDIALWSLKKLLFVFNLQVTSSSGGPEFKDAVSQRQWSCVVKNVTSGRKYKKKNSAGAVNTLNSVNCS